jgi:hypothetical protein
VAILLVGFGKDGNISMKNHLTCEKAVNNDPETFQRIQITRRVEGSGDSDSSL